MKDFKIIKFIITLLIGGIGIYLGINVLGLRFLDALTIIACITIVYSFTFIHTMLGQNASLKGSMLNQYQKVSKDMRYYIKEEKGYIPEVLLAGIIELIIDIIFSLV